MSQLRDIGPLSVKTGGLDDPFLENFLEFNENSCYSV